MIAGAERRSGSARLLTKLTPYRAATVDGEEVGTFGAAEKTSGLLKKPPPRQAGGHIFVALPCCVFTKSGGAAGRLPLLLNGARRELGPGLAANSWCRWDDAAKAQSLWKAPRPPRALSITLDASPKQLYRNPP